MNVSKIKTSFICRGINSYSMDSSFIGSYLPEAGDVGVFEVLSLGKHTRIQDEHGVNRTLVPGDRILASFGARYASAQFEGYVPRLPQKVYHLLGQGGIVGEVASTHARYQGVGPTCLSLIGYACDEARAVINTHYFVESPSFRQTFRSEYSILSVGSSMDSGKTTTAAYLVHGLKQAGLRTAFIKLTGTAYAKDTQLVEDMGADISIDFSLFGYPSTFLCDTSELIELFQQLMNRVATVNPEAVVIEIADGLLQGETANLLQSEKFMSMIDHTVLSAGDSLGMLGGLEVLSNWGIRPFALSGLITASPLLVKELEAHTVLPILGLEDWVQPERIRGLLQISPTSLSLNQQAKAA